MDRAAELTTGRDPSQWRLLAALVDPEAVARQIHAGASATGVLIVLVTASAVLAWLGVGPTVDVVRHDRSLGAEQAANAAELVLRFRGFIALTTPVVLLLKWVAVATIVWMACIAAGSLARYERIFAVVVCSSAVQVLHVAIGVAVMTVRAPGAASLIELQPLTGLNIFWPDAQGPIGALLAAVNPFDAWFVVAVAEGLRAVAGLRPIAAAWCVLPAWAFVTATQVALAAFKP